MQRGGAILTAIVMGLLGCRRPPPSEIVYQGRRPAPVPAFDAGIGPVDGGAPIDSFTRRGLLEAVAACALGRFEAARSSTEALLVAVEAFVADPTDANRTVAQEAWISTMEVWQEAELFQVGPAAASSAPGGLGLRNQIYGWPLVSRCKIEEQLVSETYASPTFGASVISGRGLGALEYLLFYRGQDNACSAFSPINGNGTWAALGAAELERRKLAYARAVAADVAIRATELWNGWAPTGGNFGQAMSLAGSGSALFATDQEALNAISDALFYVELEVKDLKLGRAIGLIECFDVTCPEALESQWAERSKEHVLANLRGFRRVFSGCGEGNSGLGFDDWLSSVDQDQLSTDILTALAGATITIEGLEHGFERTIREDPERMRGVHASLKALTDLLKVDMVSVLNLELPQIIEGDND